MQLDAHPNGVTLTGVLIGRWGGHYVLELPAVVEAIDAVHHLDARFVEIPRERVIFFEVTT